MAELMVSASTGAMKPLLGKLTTLMGEEFAKLKNLRKEVMFISDELTGMKDALEGLSHLDELDPQTKRSRDIVREMSYDIEDIVDDFMQKIGERNKVVGFVSNTIERLKTLRVHHKIAGQIEDIRNLVIETSARRQRYKIDIPVYRPNTPLSSNVVIDPRVVALYENAANLVGVEEPTNELVNLLANEDKKLKIVSIVGCGGIGKTTLANVVYGRLKGQFNQSSFVPVSQKPNIQKLLHSLLSQLGRTTSHNCELNVLLDQLREYLQNNRYFIVIDDIWDMQAWGIIKCAFPENNLGSRVLVTTRIRDVAKTCCLHRSDHILELKPLSNEDSRRLFLYRIFGSDEACPPHLSDALDEILTRCGGLPLAITSISSMLACEGSNQKERWEHVRNTLSSATNLTLERMTVILNLSYKDLPPHLRTCLLYLGMYPEDYKIDRSNLQRQWIAEGFISKQNEEDVERIARSYFNELVNRSLIQPVDFDNQRSVTACRVHDMMLDLILIKAAEENFFTIVDDPQAIIGLDCKIRRLSIRMKNHDAILFLANNSISQVRTIMMFGSSPDFSLSESKFLRVLFFDERREGALRTRRSGVLLTGLCKLYHLRYLHTSQSIECELPLQASVLKHLETLHLYDRQSFPDRAIYSPYKLLPSEIGNMKSLQDLSGFDFAEDTLDNIKGLGDLANLRYLVLICSRSFPRGVERRMDALCSSLERLGSLQELLLVNMGKIDGMFPFSPPPSPYHLQTLRMSPYSWFSRVPTWMGELRYLSELQCNVKSLVDDDIGILANLPVLSVLLIHVIAPQREMIVFPWKGFPALKLLKIDLGNNNASYLTFQHGAMPKLERLELWFPASTREKNVMTPAGLEHLLALKEISACVSTQGNDAFMTTVESVFRSAICMHPGDPRFVLSTGSRSVSSRERMYVATDGNIYGRSSYRFSSSYLPPSTSL